MTFGELLGAIFGWLGEFIEFLLSFIPRFTIIRSNERGVRYRGGRRPTEVHPGVRWYWPWYTHIVRHLVVPTPLYLHGNSLHAKGGERVQVGWVVVYQITDVVTFEVDVYEAEDSLEELAQGVARDLIMQEDWESLRKPVTEGSALGGKLKRKMQAGLGRFGVEVLSCRPTDQVKLDSAGRLFGVSQLIQVSASE